MFKLEVLLYGGILGIKNIHYQKSNSWLRCEMGFLHIVSTCNILLRVGLKIGGTVGSSTGKAMLV